MQLRLLALLGTALACFGLPPAQAETLGTFGTPGLIDMPSAFVLEDGEVALTTNRFDATSRNTLTFQMLPRLYGSFRYSTIRDYDPVIGNRYDRSFDLHYQILEETDRRPALAIGLRDFGGTGLLSGEYIVASKHFGDRLAVSGGLGWGRLAQRGGFDNPLAALHPRFETRPAANEGGLTTTGQLDFGNWFRGPVAAFGGLEYQATDRLGLQLEYSTDAYSDEVGRDLIEITSPVNLGLTYAFPNGSQLRAYLIGGTTAGVQYSYVFDPGRRPSPGGYEEAPLPVPPRDQAILASWGLDAPETLPEAQGRLRDILNAEGITLDALALSGSTATARIQNRRFDVEAQAIGRTGRAMANVLPAGISTFVIIPAPLGLPQSAVTLQRADLETLQAEVDGPAQLAQRSQISAAPRGQGRIGELDDAYPKFSYSLAPYTAFSLFDPDEPIRFDIGPELAFSYAPRPGLSFNGQFRYPIYSTIDDIDRVSNSVLPHVRSDAALYAAESGLEVNRLTVDYLFRPGPDLYGRITAGYLENMFAGVSGEVLWYPVDSNLALGAELNYVVQRDYDMLFGLQDYDVVTGHVSAYYDFGNGFLGQVDVGRYLAGDWGATFAVDREFNNGFKIGAYFTLTDVSFDEFGEGSFDKGIRFTVPRSWLTGQPSRGSVTQVIQPVLRDGGARLSVANRLYGVTRDYRAGNLQDGWGRVFR